MFKLFYIKPSGEVGGCVSPAILKFDTREEGEIVAERYRKAHAYKHTYEVFKLDAEGRIVRD